MKSSKASKPAAGLPKNFALQPNTPVYCSYSSEFGVITDVFPRYRKRKGGRLMQNEEPFNARKHIPENPLCRVYYVQQSNGIVSEILDAAHFRRLEVSYGDLAEFKDKAQKALDARFAKIEEFFAKLP